VHGEGGQATVEWVALVLVAALVLGAAAAFAGREADPGVGEAVAKRITKAARGVGRAPARAPARRAAPLPAPPAPSPPGFLTRAVGFAGGLAGIGGVAKHGWIVCLGYQRWKRDLEHPSAPTEPLPVDEALSMVNTCFNPHDYLLED
jgi:hypothetical protein